MKISMNYVVGLMLAILGVGVAAVLLFAVLLALPAPSCSAASCSTAFAVDKQSGDTPVAMERRSPEVSVSTVVAAAAATGPSATAIALSKASTIDDIAARLKSSKQLAQLGIGTEKDGSESSVVRYLRMHGKENFLDAGAEDICNRRYLLAGCCGTNYGTSILIVLSSLKTAMMLNRTLVLSVQPNTAQEQGFGFFDWPFLTSQQFERRMYMHGCSVETLDKDPSRSLTFAMGYLDDALTQSRFLSTSPQACSSILTDEDKQRSPWYHAMRCGDVETLFPQIVHYGPGEPFCFNDMLFNNPYWRKTPQAVGPDAFININDYDQAPHDHELLWAAAVQPIPALHWVLERFHGGAPQQPDGASSIDYMVHLRKPHVGVFLNAAEHFVLANWDDWGRHRWSNETDPPLAPKPEDDNTAAARKKFQIHPPAEGSQPPAGRKRELRIFVTAALWKPYGPVEWCSDIAARLAVSVPSLSLRCYYFNATAFVSEHGLPPALSMKQLEAQDHDWGVEPQWAALVNVWTSQFMDAATGRIACFADSNYCAIMREVATLATGKRWETYGTKGELNDNRDHYWRF